MKPCLQIIFCVFILIAITQNSNAQSNADCNAPNQLIYLDAGASKVGLLNGGDMWWNGSSNPMHEFPKGSNKHIFFQGGVWLSGVDDGGDIHVAAMTYRQDGNDFWPGPIDMEGNTTEQDCSAFNYFSKINQSEIDSFLNYGVIPDHFYIYPAKDNPHLESLRGEALPSGQAYAPFHDINSDGVYNPDDGDYPKIKGDQYITWIINDVGNVHGETQGQAIGVDLTCSAFTFKHDGGPIEEAATYYEMQITNRSGEDYSNFRIGIRADPDLGTFNDDFVGCDTTYNMGYVYNGDANDEDASGFGTNIPIAAVQLLDNPSNEWYESTLMGTFVYHNNDATDFGNPNNATHYYNYMNALWKNGAHVTFGGDGQDPYGDITSYMFTGEPNNQDGWSECSENNIPADRRFLITGKPFYFADGQTVRFSYAAIATFDVEYPCPDISGLQDLAQQTNGIYWSLEDETVGLADVSLVEELNIHPNPVEDILYLPFANETTIRIYNAEGKLIINNSLAIQELNVSNLSPGIYMLRMKDLNGDENLARFVKI